MDVYWTNFSEPTRKSRITGSAQADAVIALLKSHKGQWRRRFLPFWGNVDIVGRDFDISVSLDEEVLLWILNFRLGGRLGLTERIVRKEKEREGRDSFSRTLHGLEGRFDNVARKLGEGNRARLVLWHSLRRSASFMCENVNVLIPRIVVS